MGCCGGKQKCTLQMRAKVAAVADMILAVIGLSTGTYDLNRLNDIRLDKTSTPDDKDEAIRSMYLVSAILTINVIKLVMGYMLWKGAEQREIKKCKLWLVVSVALWLLHLIDFIVKLSIGNINDTLEIVSTSLQIVGRIGAMVIVTLFIRQMTKEQSGNQYQHRPPLMI